MGSRSHPVEGANRIARAMCSGEVLGENNVAF